MAFLWPILRLFKPTQEPLVTKKGPPRSKEGPFKPMKVFLKPKRSLPVKKGGLRPKEGRFRSKDPKEDAYQALCLRLTGIK